MTEQTLPDFLFAVITEQRKSISSLIDALNGAKNGINQLSVTAERSEESRRQVETLLERQSVVEGDLKFDLTQCRQHNEVLQEQIKTLEESLENTEKLRFDVTCERDLLQDTWDRNLATIYAQTRDIATQRENVSTLKIQLASLTEAETERTLALQQRLDEAIHASSVLSDAYVRLRVIVRSDKLPDGIDCTPDNIYAFTEQRARELVGFRDKVYGSPVVAWLSSDTNLTHRQYNEDDIPLIVAPTLAAGTLDCSVPPAETPVASANEGETGLVLDEG